MVSVITRNTTTTNSRAVSSKYSASCARSEMSISAFRPNCASALSTTTGQSSVISLLKICQIMLRLPVPDRSRDARENCAQLDCADVHADDRTQHVGHGRTQLGFVEPRVDEGKDAAGRPDVKP